MWDERYGTAEYVYGTKPNDFLVSVVERLPKGRVLCLAEGEGRNAVYLAGRGFDVLAVDGSAVGMQKAEKLAKERGVTIETAVAKLEDFDMGQGKWDAIVAIFCHLPPELRRDVHKKVVKALKPGGVFVLEAYTPKQLDYKTGGPPKLDMLISADGLREELDGLTFERLEEVVRDVQEGRMHSGKAAVVQAVGVK
jgi:SAM-dependent methyltransferase